MKVYIKPSLNKGDVKSDVINPVVTFLQGNEQKLFLCCFTEGQNEWKGIEDV
jgi:hypothetical protein